MSLLARGNGPVKEKTDAAGGHLATRTEGRQVSDKVTNPTRTTSSVSNWLPDYA